MMDSYYVYKHIDPRTGETKYVGKGKDSRAWTCGSYRSVNPNSKQYGHRDACHSNWQQELVSLGFLPCDWVHIEQRQLTQKEATEVESLLITELTPIFNKQGNPEHKVSKINLDALPFMKQLKQMGYSYKNIAKLVGGSTMSAHRALNGGFKGVN